METYIMKHYKKTLLLSILAVSVANALPIQGYTLDNEIKIVKAKNFMHKSIANDKEASFMSELANKFLSMQREFRSRGYVNERSERAKFLIDNPNVIGFRKASGMEDHELKDTLAELPIAYAYKYIPASLYKDHLGFAPMGAYLDTVPGWTGVVELFTTDELSCSYYEHNIKLAHGGNELIEELLTYSVNDKPTIEMVKGNESTGFVYEAAWFTKDFDRKLECAKATYDKKGLDKVIEFAKLIDVNQF